LTEERTYSGRNVGLAIVVAAIVVFTALNLFARAIRHHPAPGTPAPTVVTTTPH
jgi:NO-binding membrane sensor protein with MHYT domain